MLGIQSFQERWYLPTFEIALRTKKESRGAGEMGTSLGAGMTIVSSLSDLQGPPRKIVEMALGGGGRLISYVTTLSVGRGYWAAA